MSGRGEARRVALEIRALIGAMGEAARNPQGGAALADPDVVRGMISEEMAWALIAGIEPRLKVDREGNFYTITDLRILDDSHIDLMATFGVHPAPEGLMPMQKETLDPTIPEGRWRHFLSVDEEAVALVSRVESLADEARPPDDFSLPLEQRGIGGEAISEYAAVSEKVRRLAWLLTSRDSECLGLLAELFRRRNRFVWGSDEGPWADRNR